MHSSLLALDFADYFFAECEKKNCVRIFQMMPHFLVKIKEVKIPPLQAALRNPPPPFPAGNARKFALMKTVQKCYYERRDDTRPAA